MSVLTDQQTETCKQLLIERREQLRDEIRQELIQQGDEHYIDLAGTVHDLEEQSLANLLVDVNLADVHRHIEEDREIDAALSRIDAASYGICDDCNEPIPLTRLQANPAAIRCQPCQKHFEQMHQTTEVHTL